MGCKASKSSPQMTTIDSTFQKTQNKEFNAFFDRATGLFDKAELIRRRFVSSGQQCFDQAGTSAVMSNKYIETIKILLWSISAGYQGVILRSGIKIVQGSPFISCNPGGLCKETQDLYHSVRGYLDIVVDGSETLKIIVDGLTGMSTELMAIQKDWLDPKDFSEGATAFRENSKKFNMELLKAKSIFKVVSTERRTIETSIPQVQKLANKADVVGFRAFGQNFVKPLEIFNRFTSLQKKHVLQGNTIVDIGGEDAAENIEDDENLTNQNATTSDLIVNKNDFESPVRTARKKNNNIIVEDQSQVGTTSPYKLHNASPSKTRYNHSGALGEPVNYPGANKIQVNAPEMKDLIVKQPMTEMGGTQFPLYKFSSPTKEGPRTTNTMITKSPLEQGQRSTIPVAKVSGDHINVKNQPMQTMQQMPTMNNNNFSIIPQQIPQQQQQQQQIPQFSQQIPQQQQQQPIVKPKLVHNFSDIDAIISQATRSLPLSHGIGQTYTAKDKVWGDMNVKDDDEGINAPAENSQNIRYFSERRNYYMVHLKH